jgi:hypothetical protein
VGRTGREAHVPSPSRRFVAIGSAALFVVSALGGCSAPRQPPPKTTASQPPPTTAYPWCPEATRRLTGNKTGTQGAKSSAASNKTWNLIGFTHTSTPDPTRYPFRLERVANVCIVGGRILGNIPDTYSRTEWYDRIGLPSSTPVYDGDAFRITQKNGWVLIRDAYVERVSDAYDPNGARTARTYLDHVHAKHIRDDCIENDDKPHSIYVNDSLFDGCFNFLSEREENSSYAGRGKDPGRDRRRQQPGLHRADAAGSEVLRQQRSLRPGPRRARTVQVVAHRDQEPDRAQHDHSARPEVVFVQ